MQVAILCGGKGTRAYPLTRRIPKALVTVGDVPILRHVMDMFADQGVLDFVLLAGHKSAAIHAFARTLPATWRASVLDTGEETDTADRVRAGLTRLGETFLLAYADVLCAVPLDRLLAFHGEHGGLATVTCVRAPLPYGLVEADEGGRVRAFREKPVLSDTWISAGCFVLDHRVFQRRAAGPSMERHVLPDLVSAGLLSAYHHDGYFRSLESCKDHLELEAVARGGGAPWRVTHPAPCAAP